MDVMKGQEIMAVVTLMASQLSLLREYYVADSDQLEEIGKNLSAFAGEVVGQIDAERFHFIEVDDLGGEPPAGPHGSGKGEKPSRRKTEKKAAKTAPEAKKDSPPAEGSKGEPVAAERRQTMGVCIICGNIYLKRDPAQKCCSDECLQKKRDGLDKDGQPLSGAEQG